MPTIFLKSPNHLRWTIVIAYKYIQWLDDHNAVIANGIATTDKSTDEMKDFGK